MRNLILFCLAFLILAGLALSNPSQERHQEAIASQYSEENPITGALGAGYLFAKVTTYNNYVLFSTTTVRDERVSLGIIGLVNIRSLDIDQLPPAIMEELPENVRQKIEDSTP